MGLDLTGDGILSAFLKACAKAAFLMGEMITLDSLIMLEDFLDFFFVANAVKETSFSLSSFFTFSTGVSMTESSLDFRGAAFLLVEVMGNPLPNGATYKDDLLDRVIGPFGLSMPLKSNKSPATNEDSSFLASSVFLILR